MSQSRTYASPEKQASNKDVNVVRNVASEQNETRKCQGNWHKTDTSSSVNVLPETKKNPDAMTVAIGADLKERATQKNTAFQDVEYKIRSVRARVLCEAIHKTHPDDARQILTAALADLSVGGPMPALGEIREDARWWSRLATPIELMEYMAEAAAQLGQIALCRDHRKKLFARLWKGMPEEDRAAFLAKANKGGL